MIDINEIFQDWTLVGWRQNEFLDGWQLVDLTTSATGAYFNDVHPLLTFENLSKVCPDYDSKGLTSEQINEKFTEWLRQKTKSAIDDIFVLFNEKVNTRDCNISDYVNDNLVKFRGVIKFGVGLALLKEIIFNANVRINANERNETINQIIYSMEGDSQGRNRNSVEGRFDTAMKSLAKIVHDDCIKGADPTGYEYDTI